MPEDLNQSVNVDETALLEGLEPGLEEVQPGVGEEKPEAPAVPSLEDLQRQFNELQQLLQQKEQNLQRLEKRYTQATQRLSQLSDAEKLDQFFRSNPQAARSVQELLDDLVGEGKHPVNPDTMVQEYLQTAQQRMDLQAARLELIMENPDFKKHESEFRQWAEDEGFPVYDGRSLRLAYNAWLGTQLPKMLASAKVQALQELQKKMLEKQKGGLQGAGKPGGRIDLSKMTDEEALRALGYKSVFAED